MPVVVTENKCLWFTSFGELKTAIKQHPLVEIGVLQFECVCVFMDGSVT